MPEPRFELGPLVCESSVITNYTTHESLNFESTLLFEFRINTFINYITQTGENLGTSSV